jgi:hypothetical protein
MLFKHVFWQVRDSYCTAKTGFFLLFEYLCKSLEEYIPRVQIKLTFIRRVVDLGAKAPEDDKRAITGDGIGAL